MSLTDQSFKQNSTVMEFVRTWINFCFRSYIFPPQTRDTKEKCGHQTNGIDIFVTPQRIVLLDSQVCMFSYHAYPQ